MAIFGFSGFLGGGASAGGTGASAGSGNVTGAIRDAAQSTGASFDYLVTTAKVESGLNPNASAKTSSARGLYQFIDKTWLATVKQAGPALGYGQYADAITQNADGSYGVADPAMRQKISDLRDDPKASAVMAAAFTSSNAAQLAQSLGRQPNDGELYIAHFMGASGASQLISAATRGNGNVAAASLFPKAAAANPGIFYNRDGTARSASDVYANLMNRYDMARNGSAHAVAALQTAQTTASVQTPHVQPASEAEAIEAVNAAQSRPLFYNMFSSGNRGKAAVSSLVTDLWANRPSVAAALTGQSAPPTSTITTAALAPVAGDTASGMVADGASDRVMNLYRDLPASVRGLFSPRQ
jgi:hypothetical protein